MRTNIDEDDTGWSSRWLFKRKDKGHSLRMYSLHIIRIYYISKMIILEKRQRPFIAAVFPFSCHRSFLLGGKPRQVFIYLIIRIYSISIIHVYIIYTYVYISNPLIACEHLGLYTKTFRQCEYWSKKNFAFRKYLCRTLGSLVPRLTWK